MIEYELNNPGNKESVLRVWCNREKPDHCTVEFASQDEANRA